MRGSSARSAIALLVALHAMQAVAQALPPASRLGPLPRDQVSSGRSLAGKALPTPYDDALNYEKNRGRLFEGRIVGGMPAPVGAYPWTVAIGLANQPMSLGQFCGGSLIAKQWVLTAAHCVDGIQSADRITIKQGSNFLSSGGQLVAVTEIIVHPQWNRARYENDIALLRLGPTPVESVPVHLLQQTVADELFGTGVLAIVAGWGLTAENGAPSDVLRHVGVEVVANDTCNGPQSYPGQIAATMVCAGFVAGQKDSCQGDSGGPLMVFDRKGSYFLAGIVSWGDGCARGGKYGVYTRVAQYADWVAQKVGNPER
jgi:secreted trypsin-like serine protease